MAEKSENGCQAGRAAYPSLPPDPAKRKRVWAPFRDRFVGSLTVELELWLTSLLADQPPSSQLAGYDRSGGDIADAFSEDVRAFASCHCDYQGACGTLRGSWPPLSQPALAHWRLESEWRGYAVDLQDHDAVKKGSRSRADRTDSEEGHAFGRPPSGGRLREAACGTEIRGVAESLQVRSPRSYICTSPKCCPITYR